MQNQSAVRIFGLFSYQLFDDSHIQSFPASALFGPKSLRSNRKGIHGGRNGRLPVTCEHSESQLSGFRRRRKAGFNRAPLRVKEEAGLKEMAAAQAAAPKDQPKVKASDWLESRRQKGAKGAKRKKDTQDADHPRKKKPRKQGFP